MTGPRKQPPRGTRESSGDPKDAPERFDDDRRCKVCGVALSSYNSGPNCWRHSVGVPWRGPSAKPKLE